MMLRFLLERRGSKGARERLTEGRGSTSSILFYGAAGGGGGGGAPRQVLFAVRKSLQAEKMQQ